MTGYFAVSSQYKSSIELDPRNLIDPSDELKLDVELIEKCALLHTDQTPISGLKEHMNGSGFCAVPVSPGRCFNFFSSRTVLNDVYSELDSVLNDILGIVEKEESDDVKLKVGSFEFFSIPSARVVSIDSGYGRQGSFFCAGRLGRHPRGIVCLYRVASEGNSRLAFFKYLCMCLS